MCFLGLFNPLRKYVINETEISTIGHFLQKLKFKKITLRVVGSFQEIPDHDLMIFNTPNGELSQEKIVSS